MSGKILLARHGETDWKFRGRLQGIAPVPINDHGKEQSKMLADHLLREYGDLETIYTSPLHRAQQTSRVIYAVFGNNTGWSVENPLSEIDWGVWQGLRLDFILDEYPEFDYKNNGKQVLDVKPAKGESLNEVKQRVQPHWDQLCKKVGAENSDNPSIVITHEHPIDAIMADITEKSYYDLLLNHSHDPIELSEIVVDDDGNVTSYTNPSAPWNTV